MRGFFAEHGRYLLFDSPRYLFFAFSRRKKLFFAILLQVFLLVGGVFFYFNYSTNMYNNLLTDQQAFPAAKKFLKTILVWNGPERIETAIFGTGHQTFINNGCQENRCYIDLADQNSLPFESYDAIIINVNELWKFQLELWKILPWAIKQLQLPRWQRPSHQRFVFFSQEAPTYLPINPSNFADYFNWTMTYRLDSDIPLLYGRITPLTSNVTKAYQMRTKNYALNKTRAVVWMASHCNTSGQREKYVEQLKKYIAVDVYGRCGNLTCPRNESHWISEPHCYKLISSTYKFYLSFENSICQDYVTEKFFNLMQHDIVPVVYGGADYDRIAPPHSYIDARKFTPQELAEYLKMIDADDSLYNGYFHWKGHYRVEAGVEQMARRAFCDLCQKLHDAESSVKFYRELDSQWHVKTQCKV